MARTSRTNLRFTFRQERGEPEIDPSTHVTMDGNLYEPALFLLHRLTENEQGRWTRKELSFEGAQHAEFAESIGADRNAKVSPVQGGNGPGTLQPLLNQSGEPVGADVALDQ